jgi:dihydrofolate reductase
MGNVVYSISVSLDGYIAGPGGEIDWTAPDEELHRFHNARVLEQGAQICGRRLYQEMLSWERPELTSSGSDYEREFARIWQALPKVVFSTTLTAVEGNARLATGGPADEIARLKGETDEEIGIGGAGLAAAFVELDLVDEYHLFVFPVILGGGTPLFPPLRQRHELELVDTRAFASRIVHSRYRRA